MHLAALLSGAGALALQIVWARQLGLVLGGTTYAFTAVLSVFIAGIGGGSLAFRLRASPGRGLDRLFAGAAATLIAWTPLGLGLAGELATFVGHQGGLRASQGFNALLCAGVAAFVQGPPTVCMGLLLPTLVELAGGGRGAAGRTVGGLYAWNTAGSIVGASATASLLIPLVGTRGSAALALVAYVGVLALVLPRLAALGRDAAAGAPRRAPRGPLIAIGWGLVVAPVLALTPGPGPLETELGLYLYGSAGKAELLRDSRVRFHREGATCNVLVLERDLGVGPDGEPRTFTNLRVNGKVDGGTGADMSTQLGAAFFPHLLRPHAESVLVIGFGTGSTAGASLLFPGVRVDCAEIEPAILAASAAFHGVNHAPELSPRFRSIPDDGRNHLQGTDRRYDVVVSEPSNPWVSGVANLFTEEFYRTVRSRLEPGGVLVQWIQTYSLSAAEYAAVLRTVRSVFEHTALFRASKSDTVLVASPLGLLPSAADLDAAQAAVDASEALRSDLERWFYSTDVRSVLLTHLLLDGAGIERFLEEQGGSGHVTDSNLRLEFESPRYLFGAPDGGEERLDRRLLAAIDSGQYRSWIEGLGIGRGQLDGLRLLRRHYHERGRPDLAVELALQAQAFSPDDPELLADELLYAPPQGEADLRAGARRLVRTSPREAQRLGSGLARRGDPGRALVVFEELVAELPRSATVWTSLALVYDQLGRPDEARGALDRAVELDPLNEYTHVLRTSADGVGGEPALGLPSGAAIPPGERFEPPPGDS